MEDTKLKAELIKEYKDNQVAYTTSASASINRKNWLKKIIKEYLKDRNGNNI